MEAFNVARDGKRIYCEIHRPAHAAAPYAAVILSHGLGSTHEVNAAYAQTFAENGLAAVTFDFCGGGPGSRSDGSPLEMSVLTEAEDLNAVLDAVRAMPEIDEDRVFLMGSSQGGFVSSYVAGKRPGDIRALVLLYPAYVLQEGMKGTGNVDINSLPETFSIGGLTVGRRYVVDAASFDIYEEMAAYTGPVLLLHGDADRIVPLAFSERAARTYARARLQVIEGAGHGFRGEQEQRSAQMALAFIAPEAAQR